MMGHHTKTFWQLSKNRSIIMCAEHRVADLSALILGHIREIRVLGKVGLICRGIFLLFCLVNLLALALGLHVQERPAG